MLHSRSIVKNQKLQTLIFIFGGHGHRDGVTFTAGSVFFLSDMYTLWPDGETQQLTHGCWMFIAGALHRCKHSMSRMFYVHAGSIAFLIGAYIGRSNVQELALFGQQLKYDFR